MINLAVRSGANNIYFINFELENPQHLQLQARKTATEQAEQKIRQQLKGKTREYTSVAPLL